MLLLFFSLVACSPFDPHVPPSHSSSPFFEGWYARFIDTQAQVSAALIMGSFQPSLGTTFTQNWLALLLDYDQHTITVQVFGKEAKVTVDGHNVTQPPDPKAPAQFDYELPEFGRLSVSNGSSMLRFSLGGYTVAMNLTARIPWDPQIPNGEGPEGWLQYFDFLLPCHYYVESFGSKVSYEVANPTIGLHLKGLGSGHQETNYGQMFPSAWVWAQGSNGDTHFVLTGGKFVIAGIEQLTYVVAIRSANVNITFRTTDGDSITPTLEPCNGTFKLSATTLLRSHHLELEMSTDVLTFSDPLYFPNSTGFSNEPGCVESFRAKATFNISDSGASQSLLLTLSQCALEFGGDYLCPPK